jgi:uncharacterized membrane protein YccC
MANELAAKLKRELQEARRSIVRARSEDERNSLSLFCTYLETQLSRYEVRDPPQTQRSRSSRESERTLEIPA